MRDHQPYKDFCRRYTDYRKQCRMVNDEISGIKDQLRYWNAMLKIVQHTKEKLTFNGMED